MPTRQYYKNYRSALDNIETVSDALRKRVSAGKTLKLGPWKPGDDFPSGIRGCVVPQGAVAKKLEPDSIRPTSDHTKTRFNLSVDMSLFSHTLDTYTNNEISAWLPIWPQHCSAAGALRGFLPGARTFHNPRATRSVVDVPARPNWTNVKRLIELAGRRVPVH